MGSVKRKWTAAGVTAAILLLVAVHARAEEGRSTAYTSAKVCAGCHEDIYQMWSRSLHANSLTDPVFDVAYMQVLKTGDAKPRESCLRCHAPTTPVSRAFELKYPV